MKKKYFYTKVPQKQEEPRTARPQGEAGLVRRKGDKGRCGHRL